MSWSLLPNLRKFTYAPGRRERLRLLFAARGVGWDFHSLVWERRKLVLWQAHLKLTQRDFELPNGILRWVSGVHSFDPERGVAVIKIGEDDAPPNAPIVRTNYSWRKWDLIRNEEVARLQDCADPFDAFNGNDARAA